MMSSRCRAQRSMAPTLATIPCAPLSIAQRPPPRPIQRLCLPTCPPNYRARRRHSSPRYIQQTTRQSILRQIPRQSQRPVPRLRALCWHVAMNISASATTITRHENAQRLHRVQLRRLQHPCAHRDTHGIRAAIFCAATKEARIAHDAVWSVPHRRPRPIRRRSPRRRIRQSYPPLFLLRPRLRHNRRSRR